ncbi:AAA family ATPase [Prevotella sp.]|uniref:AAA family ATPase n=1 Tax=Prevotella sp. TaxID=59823 RepID=UPI003FD811F7
MENSKSMERVLQLAVNIANNMRHEYIMPEHLLMALLKQDDYQTALSRCDVDAMELMNEVTEWLGKQEQRADPFAMPLPSAQFSDTLRHALRYAVEGHYASLTETAYSAGILSLEESQAAYILGSAVEGDEKFFLDTLEIVFCDETPADYSSINGSPKQQEKDDKSWLSLVSDISQQAKTHTPIIGREKELSRTIEILCRMEKNNPLHVGDPGVGKTAIIYGLANMINNGRVPERLLNKKIYGINLSRLLAGAQYRGDFEKRLTTVLDGAMESGAILYIDEIHNIMGAGKGGDGGPDASNIMKPYLESGKVHFIGATTHEEYNRKMAKDRAIMRRFQMIDIKEPSVEETIQIIKGLQPSLQKFHNVIYHKDAIDYAVRASQKYISDRRLPDKAIDIIDEAGAYLEVHKDLMVSKPYVTKALINEILMKNLKIEANVLKESNNSVLSCLGNNIKDRIFGQDNAVEKVTEAILMAKAGLSEDDKPLASLLFVGPTGVGKTEIAKVLAKELGVELVRFDMSEYTEKHTVAKLIGSPAGYVGYDDGGLLTDAVRNTPNCVLLLDEIEKAHSDIYNILLQIMDYATLTDNHGRKTDFRNVILIMTSNAGAQYAAQANIGFGGGVSRGEAMMKQVKKTFKPEFINRLTDIVVFSEMDENMAALILRKKLSELDAKLQQRKVSFEMTDEAFSYLLKKGFTKEYGAREMDRVIARELKPLFMKEILFGKLKKGGSVTVESADGILKLLF